MNYNDPIYTCKRIKTYLVVVCITLAASMLNGQTRPENALDFWVGSWSAFWNDSLKGTNEITKTLKDRVIEENFTFNDRSFKGKSWSVYDPKSKLWQQTWVDDSGAYLTFKGGQVGDSVVLKMSDKRIMKGRAVAMRMVFYNIKTNSFNWDWQSSEDEKNWQSNWLISYTRKE